MKNKVVQAGVVISKIFWYFLWFVIIWTLALLVVGFIKYSWSVWDYLKYLDNKEWDSVMEEVHFWDPSSITTLFWEEVKIEEPLEQFSGSVIQPFEENIVAEELDITGITLTWVEELDVYDPEFKKEFEDFFVWSKSGKNQESWLDWTSSNSENYGFVTPNKTGN